MLYYLSCSSNLVIYAVVNLRYSSISLTLVPSNSSKLWFACTDLSVHVPDLGLEGHLANLQVIYFDPLLLDGVLMSLDDDALQ